MPPSGLEGKLEHPFSAMSHCIHCQFQIEQCTWILYSKKLFVLKYSRFFSIMQSEDWIWRHPGNSLTSLVSTNRTSGCDWITVSKWALCSLPKITFLSNKAHIIYYLHSWLELKQTNKKQNEKGEKDICWFLFSFWVEISCLFSMQEKRKGLEQYQLVLKTITLLKCVLPSSEVS